MADSSILRFKTISEFHRVRQLPKPDHPLISIINVELLTSMSEEQVSMIFDFYCIALKKNFNARMRYGQQDYDYDDGVLFFMSPGQVFSVRVHGDSVRQQTGWMLFIHPDFLWKTTLAKTIRQYEFFDYAVNEALFLSDKEENILNEIMRNIGREVQVNIDRFSQDIVIAQIELLLKYSERFYSRQFITRKIASHSILDRLEVLLNDYFDSSEIQSTGLPTVQFISRQLNVSPNYLSSLLKVLTGQSTQQHIHGKLIEKAKEKLSTSELTVSEIAYELGFEHSQSFSKLFKAKTMQSPQDFRKAFK